MILCKGLTFSGEIKEAISKYEFACEKLPKEKWKEAELTLRYELEFILENKR